MIWPIFRRKSADHINGFGPRFCPTRFAVFKEYLRIGIIWTYLNIKENWEVYRSYPSFVAQLRLKNVAKKLFLSSVSDNNDFQTF